MALSYKRLNVENIEIGRLQSRGNYHFCAIGYKGQPLIVDTPSCITPTGIHADDSRNWMDVELDTANNRDHQMLYDMFKDIDNLCVDKCIENLDKWFGKNVTENDIEEQFKPPLTSGWGNEPALLRIEVVSEKPEDLVDADGHVISPRDVTPLSHVKLRLHLIGLWASEKFLGTHWRAIAVKAKLADPNSKFRRSSSPRRMATPPDLNRNRRRHVSEGLNTEQKQKPESRSQSTQSSRSVQPANKNENELRRERVREMLRQIKAQKEAEASKNAPKEEPKEEQPKLVIQKNEEPADVPEQKDRHQSSNDRRRRHSDDYSDYSDDDRRRYSSDRRRSYSDYSDDRYSDDDRRRYSDDRYSDDDRRRYSDDRYYSDDDDRRRRYSDDRYSDDRRRYRR